MGHSRAEKAESHDRIMTSAARAIREKGADNLSIADLMESAGLTHGAFYSHFESRAALIEAAVERALSEGEARFGSVTPKDIRGLVRRYLSASHRDNPQMGCALGTLSTEARRTEGARRLLAERLDCYVDRLAEKLGDDDAATDQALAIWSTMIGAITLARLSSGERSDRILKAARDAIHQMID